MRLRDGRLLFSLEQLTQDDDVQAASVKAVYSSRHVLNEAVSHDAGRSWHGSQENARQALFRSMLDDQVSYPRMLELPDGLTS